MRVSIVGQAQAFRVDTDDLVLDTAVLRLLDGVELDDLCWANYVDDPLADAGVIGGIPIGQFVRDSALEVEVRYWSPSQLGPELVEQLLAFTAAQISDGAAESGLSAGRGDLLVQVSPENLVPRQTEDGRVVEPASRVAICARDGDIPGLREALAKGGPLGRGCVATPHSIWPSCMGIHRPLWIS